MIRPPGRPSCCAAKAWASKMVERVLTAQCASSMSASSVSSDPSLPLQAWLHTRMSRCPSARAAVVISWCGAPGSARSSSSWWRTAVPASASVTLSMTARGPPRSAPQGWAWSCGVSRCTLRENWSRTITSASRPPGVARQPKSSQRPQHSFFGSLTSGDVRVRRAMTLRLSKFSNTILRPEIGYRTTQRCIHFHWISLA